jgi:hypothetical protein
MFATVPVLSIVLGVLPRIGVMFIIPFWFFAFSILQILGVTNQANSHRARRVSEPSLKELNDLGGKESGKSFFWILSRFL